MTDRLPRLTPSLQSPEQRELATEIAGGPRSKGPQLFQLTGSDGALNGPFNAMLYAPEVGRALQGLGAAIRYRTSLSDRVREMAILIVAAWCKSEFEAYAHEAIGRATGLSEEIIESIRDGEMPVLDDDAEQTAVLFVTALCHGSAIDDAEFDRVRETLGMQQVYELSTLVGYYSTLALQLRLFKVGKPGVTATSA